MNEETIKIANHNFNCVTDSTLEPINILKIMILSILVKKICKNKKNNSYYFSVDDDTDENNKLIDNWFEIIMKIAPCKNITNLKKSTKKIYSVLRHLSKSMANNGIEFESKTINIIVNGEKKTKFVHLISGLSNE